MGKERVKYSSTRSAARHRARITTLLLLHPTCQRIANIIIMLQNNSNRNPSSINGYGCQDDGDNGKKGKSPGATSYLTKIKNSPPAPPPTLRQAICRRRRRSDLALFIIGCSSCLLSIFHIKWHSDNLPHSYHNTGGGKSRPQLKLKGKSALQQKLDEFVKSRENNSERASKSKAKVSQRIKDDPKQLKTHHVANNGTSAMKQIGNSMQSSGMNQDGPHPVAHLNCADHGGPNNQQIIDEMVFWSDIPSDSSYLSPMHPLNDPHTPDDTERFLTFEPDHGGWNNIRMAMETALVMSHAMGRTLVLPPEQRMYLLGKSEREQKSSFGFNDFFHLDAISIEHRGFKVITMEEFLVREGKAGKLKTFGTDQIEYPPGNETSYGSGKRMDFGQLFKYLRSVGNAPEWDPWDCALAIPSSTDPQSIVELNTTFASIMNGSYGKPKPKLEEFNSNPTPSDASMAERLREMLADRDNLCIYDKSLQESKLIHLKVEKGTRLLTHFYGT